jgi:hypothetical protein
LFTPALTGGGEWFVFGNLLFTPALTGGGERFVFGNLLFTPALTCGGYIKNQHGGLF